MKSVTLLLHAPLEGSVELRGLQVATPEQDPERRLVLWSGVPSVRVDHPVIAPNVLDGELDGRRTYGEAIPRGLWLAAVDLPDAFQGYVVGRLLDGLSALHEAGIAHGGVQRGKVVLGVDGEVVLVGAGRHPGREVLDLLSLDGLASARDAPTLEPSDPGSRARELAVRSGNEDRARLAAWVAERLVDEPVVQTVVVVSLDAVDAVDEVVIDLGPELTDGGRGILDHWSHTGTSGTVSEVTSEVASTQHALAVTLWGRLSSGARAQPPPERFAAVQGVSSRAIRAILADEAPEPLPLPLLASPGPFVIHVPQHDDMPTMIGPALDGIVPRPSPPQRYPIAQWLVAMAVGGALVYALMTWWGS